jgi:hypothetical protein
MASSDPSKRVKASSTTVNSRPSHVSSIDTDGISPRLNNMSIEDRSQGLYDLHGVADMPDENPEMLNTKVGEMNNVLSSGYASFAVDTVPYRTALDMDAAYVEGLKIPFLRAAGYNSREAAALMLRFFGNKLDLFGDEKLVREIRLRDLDRPGEMEALRKGMVQVLPHRDRSGRTVLLNVGRINQQYDIRVVVSPVFMTSCCTVLLL